MAVAWGCVGSLPETHYYALSVPQNADSRTGALQSEGLMIGIESFAVDPPYDQDRLVYRPSTGSTEVGFYSYHRWAAPLGRLVAVALGEGLRGTAGVTSIEPALANGIYSARLRGRVTYFEEIESATIREARLSIDIELLDLSGEVLWAETLTGAARSDGGEEPIAHFNRAFDDLLTQARAGLASALE
jgi:uncharacterized lipoprotein YmbA